MERRLEHVRAGVIPRDRFATHAIHRRFDRLALGDRPFRDRPDEIGDPVGKFPRIFDGNHAGGRHEPTRIADLAAALRVERIVLQHDRHRVAVGCLRNFFSFFSEQHKRRLAVFVLCRERRGVEFRRVGRRHVHGYFRPRASGAFLLLGHRRFEARFIDGKSRFGRDFLRQFPRETIRVVQLEDIRPREHRRLFFLRIFQHFGEQIRPRIERLLETAFFRRRNLFDEILFL